MTAVTAVLKNIGNFKTASQKTPLKSRSRALDTNWATCPLNIEIKNEPLRLVLSDKERALIRQGLRASMRQCFAWVMVFALSVGAIFGGYLGYRFQLQGLWRELNYLLVLVGLLAFLPSLIRVAEALFAIRNYVKYGDELDAFLRRFNRAG